MELVELVRVLRVVEVSAKSRNAAIRALVKAARWSDEGIAMDTVLDAIEEREAAAQTIVAKGFALPHAVIDWKGDYRVVLGRSRQGVEYGVPSSERVQLIVLFIVGRGRGKTHLELLAALSELFEAEEFRRAIVQAPDVASMQRLLYAKVGLPADHRIGGLAVVPRLSTILVRQAIQLMELLSAQAMLMAVDELESVPWDALSQWHGRLLIVTSKKNKDSRFERPDTFLFEVPHASLSRMDRANLGLLLATSSGLLDEEASVVCVTGPGDRRLDSITITSPEPKMHAVFSGKTTRRAGRIRPAVLLRVLSLAIELAAEGREAQPVGAMFVVGDTRQVMRHARQLVLNPFHGFSRPLRNVLDPSLAETIKEFALIDGAFIVEGDGTVLTAGAYLVPKSPAKRLPQGLGTRHQTAAAITAHTQAMAITVSQSTGTVTVFRNGSDVFKLERAVQRRW